MKRLHLMVGFLSAALLAACSGSGGVSNGVVPATAAHRTIDRQGKSTSYKLLYSFGSKSGDGEVPQAALAGNGMLYGTNYQGGGTNDFGTVFSITPSGTETVLHAFGPVGSGDGLGPEAGLVFIKGMLYGTAIGGGANDTGTVFSISPTGVEKVVYSFGVFGSVDGQLPRSLLVSMNGVLYGTTKQGGQYDVSEGGQGTVFSVTPNGTEKVLHSFGASGDGAVPQAGLVSMNGVLYGTTQGGGANGSGTIFSISTSGVEKVLYSFGAFGSGDGEGPFAGLIALNGVLYGTTIEGGANNTGTVFSVTPSGTEKIVYSFGASGSGDGAYPQWAGVIAVNGVLYGTTVAGGANGFGTVFSVTTSGSETVLHSFGAFGSGDGAGPMASLTLRAKTLYGTTAGGGADNEGTVFSINP